MHEKIQVPQVEVSFRSISTLGPNFPDVTTIEANDLAKTFEKVRQDENVQRLKKRTFFQTCPESIFEELRNQSVARCLFCSVRLENHFSSTGNKKLSGFFSFAKCRIVTKKCKKGTLWELSRYILLQKIKKKR